jgi:hypothetical protein
MTIMAELHAKTSPENFAPAVMSLGVPPQSPSFSLTFDRLRHFGAYLSHQQMVDLRDVLTKAILQSPIKCAAECEEEATVQCGSCSRRYCTDHCSNGTDGSPYGAYAVPASCAACDERSAA